MTMGLSSPLARVLTILAVVVAGLVAPAATASAQANLSAQGFGYSPGQFSARAQGTGGAVGELDPMSPINPATIAIFPGRILFFQADPEFRTVTTANGTDHTSIARYPVVFGAMPVKGSLVVSLSSSTLLDRTSTTTFSTTQPLGGGDSVQMFTTYHIDGAMNDVRLAGAWTPFSWLRVGLGAHAIAGHNLVDLQQSFPDSERFATFTQSRILGFSGSAASAGFQIFNSQIDVSASARVGGSLHMSSEDTLLTSARVPNYFGASVAYMGITGSTIAVRTAREDWSSVGGLGTPGLIGVNAWDTSVGAELQGPKFGQRYVLLRGGFRTRTLPFQAANQTVTEKSFSGGIGTSFAQGHVLTDLGVIRATRSADIAAQEHAWTISVGVAVRP
ncbi:MAG: hypothetical protein ACREPM_22605 [Gemmatimonadaceae bacterium]